MSIVENSENFQKSIKSMSFQKTNLMDILEQKINELVVKLDGLGHEKEKLNKRLNFLLDDDDLEMAKDFKEEYKLKYKKLENERKDLMQKIKSMEKELKKLDTSKDSSGDTVKMAKEALNKLNKTDRSSLKAIYRALFEKIIVTSKNSVEVELKFILKNAASRLNSLEDTFRISNNLVGDKR
ncbi:MAG: chromosome segregation ATPase [Bacteriovoracaceae bacterium]